MSNDFQQGCQFFQAAYQSCKAMGFDPKTALEANIAVLAWFVGNAFKPEDVEEAITSISKAFAESARKNSEERGQ